MIADFMRELLAGDPFGTGDKVPWIDFAVDSTTVAITHRQLAFIVTNVLMGNTIPGIENGLSAALERCSAREPTQSGLADSAFVMSILSFLAVLSQELKDGSQGKWLVGARPGSDNDSWKSRLDLVLSNLTVCNEEGPPLEVTSSNECGLLEFMGGNGLTEEFQALTDIAGASVGGGAELCSLASTQDESLVQFYTEVLVFAFFRGQGEMLPSPFTLLGARRYMNSISGQTTADPPYRNMAGLIPSTDWLDQDIMQATVQVPLSSAGSVPMAPSSYVAVASSAWWINDPDGCEHSAALNNNCSAQRAEYDADIALWYHAFEPTMYGQSIQDAFRFIVRSIGTGPWGAGVWWGDSQMYFLKVWLATSLTPNVRLDYYTYPHFVENPCNQCFVLGGPNACRECIQAGQPGCEIYESRCGTLSLQDMIAKFEGQSGQVLYEALGAVGPPPAQVFDTLGSWKPAAAPEAAGNLLQALASTRGGQPSCRGFEYKVAEGQCSVWMRDLQGSAPKTGSICIRRAAP